MQQRTTEDGYVVSDVVGVGAWRYPGTEDWDEERRQRLAASALTVRTLGVRLTETVMADLVAAHRERPARPLPVREDARSVVYYALLGARIKIGTTVNLQRRMHAVPHDEVLAIEPGGYDLERQRHEQFADLRIGRGEWFHAGPALVAHVEALRAA